MSLKNIDVKVYIVCINLYKLNNANLIWVMWNMKKLKDEYIIEQQTNI